MDRLIHEFLRLIRTGGRNDHSVRDRARSCEICRGLVRRAVRSVLKADVRKHRDDRRLRQRGHRERQISLGPTELPERIHDRDKAGFGETRAGADHVCLSNADFDETVRQTFMEQADAGGALHVRGNRIDGQALLRGAGFAVFPEVSLRVLDGRHAGVKLYR